LHILKNKKCFPFSKMDKKNVQNQFWLWTFGKKFAIFHFT